MESRGTNEQRQKMAPYYLQHFWHMKKQHFIMLQYKIGNRTAATGDPQSAFNFWFSTKPEEPQWGLYYYGYRFLSMRCSVTSILLDILSNQPFSPFRVNPAMLS
jgi:hypothetical protein